jgi:hypothetical protein
MLWRVRAHMREVTWVLRWQNLEEQEPQETHSSNTVLLLVLSLTSLQIQQFAIVLLDSLEDL